MSSGTSEGSTESHNGSSEPSSPAESASTGHKPSAWGESAGTSADGEVSVFETEQAQLERSRGAQKQQGPSPTAPPAIPAALYDFPKPRDETAPYRLVSFNPVIEFQPTTPEQPPQGSCAQALVESKQKPATSCLHYLLMT